MYQCIVDHYTETKGVPDVVVYDFFASSAADAADYFGCPAISVFPNAAVTINSSVVMPAAAGVLNKGWTLFMDFGEAIFARYMLSVRNKRRATRSLPPMLEQDVFPCRTMKRLTIGCTGLGLEFASKALRYGPLFVMVGPSLPAQPELLSNTPHLENWVNAQTLPIVYVAFGTQFSHTEASVQSLQQQLTEAGVAVIWSLPENQQVWLKQPTGPSWCIEKFVPQVPLLASGKLTAFVSHCGSNSVYEALLSRVPIVCCPQHADQPGNSVRLEAAGVGVISHGGVKGVAAALKEVVAAKQEMKQKADKLCELLATYGGAERAATLIEETAHFGYNHLIPGRVMEPGAGPGKGLVARDTLVRTSWLWSSAVLVFTVAGVALAWKRWQ